MAMKSFGWKKKTGEKIIKEAKRSFESDAKDEEDEEINSGEIDWLTLAPKKRLMHLEDACLKSNRLKHEGELLAESERYWEAVKKWEEASQLTPENAVLFELKAQAYMSLNEVYPAITAASKAVELSKLWWVAHQTLGRAHLHLGEVRIAVKCFSRALHLNPSIEELWTEDLKWAVDLLRKKQILEAELKQTASNSVQIEELNEGEEININSNTVVPFKGKKGSLDISLLHMNNSKSTNDSKNKSDSIKKIPQNYVVMRD